MKEHNYFGIDATIIADSITERGERLTTFIVTFPRIVLAEFNTHRMLTKNSASSRAIPNKKMLDNVKNHPFIPIRWMKEHKGMQGTEYWTNERLPDSQPYVEHFRNEWLRARNLAIQQAEELSNYGLTKQIANRLLEPFLWHTVIVTGTEWENFFALRAHGAAEIHIQDLAYKMLQVYNENTPTALKAGEWHIPFGDRIDEDELGNALSNFTWGKRDEDKRILEAKVKVATARCARVSYMTFDGEIDYKKDIELHDRLLASGHMSPFEHCARVMNQDEYLDHSHYDMVNDIMVNGVCGNFKGFIQYRKLIPGENKSDNRVIRK